MVVLGTIIYIQEWGNLDKWRCPTQSQNPTYTVYDTLNPGNDLLLTIGFAKLEMKSPPISGNERPQYFQYLMKNPFDESFPLLSLRFIVFPNKSGSPAPSATPSTFYSDFQILGYASRRLFPAIEFVRSENISGYQGRCHLSSFLTLWYIIIK